MSSFINGIQFTKILYHIFVQILIAFDIYKLATINYFLLGILFFKNICFRLHWNKLKIILKHLYLMLKGTHKLLECKKVNGT